MAKEEQRLAFPQSAIIIMMRTDQNFINLAKRDAEVRSLLARISSVGKNIPKARGYVEVRTLDEWFGSYSKHIIWDVEKLKSGIERCVSSADLSKRFVFEQVEPAILDIHTELGLVELKLTDLSMSRINASSYLSTTQRSIKTLKDRLLKLAKEAAALSIDQSFDSLFDSDAERALNDDLGSVAFHQENDLIEIAPGTEGERADLRALVEDALADVANSRILDRVDQRNRQAADLVRNYAQRFRADGPGSDLLLYSAGVKISVAMDFIANPTFEDEQVPQEFLHGLRTLIVHHEAYIWSVPRIREVIESRRRTLESYLPLHISSSSLQLVLLTELEKAEFLIGPRTRNAINELTTPANKPEEIGVGVEAIQYGLLRGALQFMGRAIVQSKKELLQVGRESATKIAATVVASAVLTSPLFSAIESFFTKNSERLFHLAASAQDWGWVQYVLQTLHLG